MKADEYKLMLMAVESGVACGWRRAHKHVEAPSEGDILTAVETAVMNEICEWFSFNDNETRDDDHS